MKTCTKCNTEKPITEFGKRTKSKDGLHFRCKSCRYEEGVLYRSRNKEKESKRQREWERNNPEKVHAKNKRWRMANRESQIERAIDWQKKNEERNRENQRQWRKNNPTLIKEYKTNEYVRNAESIKERGKRYRQLNPEKESFWSAAKRARKRMACPKWADKKKIKEIYRRAKELSMKSGVTYHVDHVIPLKSKVVCGLHVHDNLQIITAKENLEKKNSFFI